jgi:hypothetical protein
MQICQCPQPVPLRVFLLPTVTAPVTAVTILTARVRNGTDRFKPLGFKKFKFEFKKMKKIVKNL